MKPDKLKGHLDLLLLELLGEGAGHGYSLISTLRDRTEGTFDLPEGTVYPALHRLEDAGLVASDWSVDGGRRRRVYRLTASGAETLVVEREQWRRFSRAIERVVGGPSQIGPNLIGDLA